MLRRFFLAAAVVACALSASVHASEQGGEGEIDRAGFEDAQAAMDGEDMFRADYGICPADLFRTQRPILHYLIEDRSIDLSVCEQDAMSCYLRCKDARSGAACFALARAFQENESRDKGSYWEKLFAHSCAIGYPAGCTNRGAGIRNGSYEGDPFLDVDEEERDLCLFRSFEIACDHNEAWGCAMHGQSYRLGEGVAADKVKAARFYEKSCDINPEFAACRFSRSGLALIED